MAIVGAARRLATELVVIIASAIHEMYLIAGLAAAAPATGWDRAALRSPGRSAGTSIAAIGTPPYAQRMKHSGPQRRHEKPGMMADQGKSYLRRGQSG